MVETLYQILLTIFPFGQLIKFDFLNFFDFAAVIFSIFVLFAVKNYKIPKWYKYFLYFWFFCLFSLLINYDLANMKSALYLLRLLVFSSISIFVFNFKNKKNIINGLLAVGWFNAILGWIQYFLYRDLRPLSEFGWDDHYLRMAGAFLDPTFFGLILILTIILSLNQKKYLLTLFFAITVLFTYSRISYLLLFLIFLFDFIRNKNILRFLIFNSIFLVLVFIPKNVGEGTKFTRSASIIQKMANYRETFEIFKKSPVFGVGFNNLCDVRKLYFINTNTESHSCSGSDSSILFLLATTGIVGLIFFISFVFHLPVNILLLSSFFAVFIHSFQANSLFYPHIMFWMFSLLGLKNKINR